MSEEQSRACMGDDALQHKVLARRLESGRELHVASTPTFFMNGRRVEGAQPYSQLSELLTS
jgi:protein-disulfide isomerase